MEFNIECNDLKKLVFLSSPAFNVFKEMDIPKEVHILNPLSKNHKNYIKLENQTHINDLYEKNINIYLPRNFEKSLKLF